MVIMDQVQAGIFPGLSLLEFLNFDIDTFGNLQSHHITQGWPQCSGGAGGGTGHPWDFNISETGDTIHQIR